mgnify:FL=1
MRSFAEVSEEYNSLSKRLNEIRPEARAVALQAYKTGMRTSDIVSALGIATPTFYVWLREAHEPVTGNRRNTEFNVEIDTATEVEFGWFENKVRVDRSGKRVFIDPERINFTGDRTLGQLLVSGTDKDLLNKFNRFVYGK